ncbi:ABC transporter substrate-binding protein [Leucobacter aridicollis]|uniref:ABC transporter substrate-binding protein n=1 Tax=Leucobacter aridicollis TaxID=283878 RepID=UPI000E656B33|nr:extracellular solute-binding protein [Leucobacter aridicollis]UTX53066.1 extracellular solute-binding protein [Leucobacter aridicollis]
MPKQTISRRTQLLAVGSALLAGALALTGCASGAGGGADESEFGFAAAEQVADSPITVWVDASREPAIAAFREAHPDIAVEYEVYDGNAGGSGTFQTKVALMDQSGEGWPDVVFSSQQNDAIWASQETNGVQPFAAPLNKGLLSDEFLAGFAAGSLDYGTVDGTVYGLRNDLAQVVTYYNQDLLDEFGYEVPTTWEEYGQLGDKLAEEHPGYILGSLGDAFMTYVYYGGTESPVFQAEGTEFSTDTSDKNTQKITKILDRMLQNGTLVQDSFFSATFADKYADKIVALPGPVWYTGAIFQGALATPAGKIGVAAPLKWEGGEVATGNVGGGIWYASSHSKNLAAVAEFMTFVTSAPEFQVEASAAYPAYTAAAEGWLAKLEETNYFVNADFKEIMTSAADSIWSGWSVTKWSPETAWATVVIPGVAEGKTIESLLPAWEEKLKNEATVNGYTVK